VGSRVCCAAGVAADMDFGWIPFSEAAKAVISLDSTVLESALTGGDDYEIVCTVPEAKSASFQAAAKTANVAATEIGEIKKGEGARFLAANGEALKFKRASFSHF